MKDEDIIIRKETRRSAIEGDDGDDDNDEDDDDEDGDEDKEG